MESTDGLDPSNENSVIFSHITSSYTQSRGQTTSFKLIDLYKAFPLKTEQRIQTTCSRLVDDNKLILSSGRSRVIVYEIHPSILASLPVTSKPAITIASQKNDSAPAKKKLSHPLKSNVEKRMKHDSSDSSEDAMESSEDIDRAVSVTKTKTPKSNRMDIHEAKSSFKTPASKPFIDRFRDDSPTGVQFVNKVTASPPEPIMAQVIHFIRCANTGDDLTYVSAILPKCLENGIKEEEYRECLKALMDENKIFVNADEIYIM